MLTRQWYRTSLDCIRQVSRHQHLIRYASTASYQPIQEVPKLSYSVLPAQLLRIYTSYTRKLICIQTPALPWTYFHRPSWLVCFCSNIRSGWRTHKDTHSLYSCVHACTHSLPSGPRRASPLANIFSSLGCSWDEPYFGSGSTSTLFAYGNLGLENQVFPGQKVNFLVAYLKKGRYLMRMMGGWERMKP